MSRPLVINLEQFEQPVFSATSIKKTITQIEFCQLISLTASLV